MADPIRTSVVFGRLSTVLAGLIIGLIQSKGLILSDEKIQAFNSFVGVICTPETFDLIVQGIALAWASAFALVSKVKEKLREGE
jgi:hypothetical protein